MADQTLAQQIRAQYPGAYDKVPDMVLETQWKKKHPEAPPNFATKGMTPASKPGDAPTGNDLNQEGMEYGLAGALPPDTPGPLAAGGAGLLAIPAAIAAGAGMPELGGAALGLRDAAVAGGATYAVSKLPTSMQMPAELALAALGMKTARGQKISKMFGFGKGTEPEVAPTPAEEMGLTGEKAVAARASAGNDAGPASVVRMRGAAPPAMESPSLGLGSEADNLRGATSVNEGPQSVSRVRGNAPVASPSPSFNLGEDADNLRKATSVTEGPSSVVRLKSPMSAKAADFSTPLSPTGKMFEDMMNTLHPEENGPLPGNGTVTAKPRDFASKSKSARGNALSDADREIYSQERAKGATDAEAMDAVKMNSKMRAPYRYMGGVAAKVAKGK